LSVNLVVLCLSVKVTLTIELLHGLETVVSVKVILVIESLHGLDIVVAI
jgi:hypothetical protein